MLEFSSTSTLSPYLPRLTWKTVQKFTLKKHQKRLGTGKLFASVGQFVDKKEQGPVIKSKKRYVLYTTN